MSELLAAQQVEVEALRIQLALVGLALALVAARQSWISRNNSKEPLAQSRFFKVAATPGYLVALFCLALGSYHSYYTGAGAQNPSGFKVTDVYHYYMGSKYLPEVGYFDLYHCTVIALIDAGVESQYDLPRIRDQRTLSIASPEDALAAGRVCRDRFSQSRWGQFAADVDWFQDRLHGDEWHKVLRDHGYNPTPVWSALGGFVTSRIELDSRAFEFLLGLDRALMLVSFAFIAWAFGFEAAALATIVWGTGYHWGYIWIGDSLLRNFWLAALLIGLALLRKKKFASAGVGLALSSLLRIFPGVFLATILIQGIRAQRREGRVPEGVIRLFAGAGVFAGVTLVWVVFVSGLGPEVFADFIEKIGTFRDRPGLNKIGLSTLCWRSVMTATGHLVTDESGKAILTPATGALIPVLIWSIQIAVLLPALAIFWKAIGRVRTFEAACLGSALIPLLSSPANYYYSFVICGVFLATGRPRLKIYVLLAAGLWIANGLYFYRVPEEYIGASVIALVYSIGVLAELAYGGAVSGDRERAINDSSA